MVTYKDIKEKILFAEEFVIISLNKQTKASSFLMELTLLEVLKDLAQKVNVYKISENEQKDVVEDFQLFAEPLILVFVYGELKDVIYLPISKKNLHNKLSFIFNDNINDKTIQL